MPKMPTRMLKEVARAIGSRLGFAFARERRVTMRKPRIGDIVYYHEAYGGSLEAAAALVIAILSQEGKVKLQLFRANGNVNPKEATYAETATPYSWTWPPP